VEVAPTASFAAVGLQSIACWDPARLRLPLHIAGRLPFGRWNRNRPRGAGRRSPSLTASHSATARRFPLTPWRVSGRACPRSRCPPVSSPFAAPAVPVLSLSPPLFALRRRFGCASTSTVAHAVALRGRGPTRARLSFFHLSFALHGHARCAAHAYFRGHVAAPPTSAAPPTHAAPPTPTSTPPSPTGPLYLCIGSLSPRATKPITILRQHGALAPY
jgi:hypothetical protein